MNTEYSPVLYMPTVCILNHIKRCQQHVTKDLMHKTDSFQDISVVILSKTTHTSPLSHQHPKSLCVPCSTLLLAVWSPV